MRWLDSSTDAWRADWAPLARHLTATVPDWLAWKAADGLQGSDLDSAAPAAAWPQVEESFAEWGRAQGLTAVVRCTDVPAQLILVGCGGIAGPRLLQLDVVDRKLQHGVPVWTAEDLLAVATVRDGVRRLPAGAEGVARALVDPRDDAAPALLAEDPVGGERLGVRLGLPGRLAARNARSLLRPVLVLRALPRLRGRRPRPACSVLAALAQERLLGAETDADEWLGTVAPTHGVRRLG